MIKTQTAARKIPVPSENSAKKLRLNEENLILV
jgi:hypothetical protein